MLQTMGFNKTLHISGLSHKFIQFSSKMAVLFSEIQFFCFLWDIKNTFFKVCSNWSFIFSNEQNIQFILLNCCLHRGLNPGPLAQMTYPLCYGAPQHLLNFAFHFNFFMADAFMAFGLGLNLLHCSLKHQGPKFVAAVIAIPFH